VAASIDTDPVPADGRTILPKTKPVALVTLIGLNTRATASPEVEPEVGVFGLIAT
jgi:hypothetical protein